MAVSNFPPNTQRQIQGRNWTLSGSQPGGTSTTVGDLAHVYASDFVRITNSYNNGIGTGVIEGQDIGFVIEKVTASAPASDSALWDFRYNLEVTDVIPTEYEFTETGLLNTYLDPGGQVFKIAKTGTLSFNAVRNFADTYINGSPFLGAPDYDPHYPLDPEEFGNYRLVSYARDAGGTDFQTLTIDTFELRGLAITNFKTNRKYIEVDGVHNTITVSGDISVYPNQTDNGVAGWVPSGNLQYQIYIKHPSLPPSLWVTIPAQTILTSSFQDPDDPGNDGVIASFEYTWDGKMADGNYYFQPMVFEARAIAPVAGSPTRTTITPLASTEFTCKKCQSVLFMAILNELISIFGDPNLATPMNGSSLESESVPGSMGYGWFSTENIKVFDLLSDGSDLVYCDEAGMCRRWLLSGGNYVPVLPDNRMTISMNGGSTVARYVVTWPDQSRREFDADGKIRRHVDRNGHATNYTRSASYFAIDDGRGRTVYNHFDYNAALSTYDPQPTVINDDADRNEGRRYLLEYYTEGSPAVQTRLKSIEDPVGDKVVFEYDGDGQVRERREELTNHHRSVVYTYDPSNTGRLATMTVSSKLLQPDPDVITEHFKVTYSYKVPFTFDADGNGADPPVVYLTTRIVTEDLQDTTNPVRTVYMAHDSLSRLVGEFEYVEDDENDDPIYIATLHEYNDPSVPGNPPDPWLRVLTTQVNKGTMTQFEYTDRGNVKRILDNDLNETIISYVEEDPMHPAYANFKDLVTEIRRPAPDLDNAPTVFYPTTKFTYNAVNGNLESVEDADGNASSFRYNGDGQVNRVINRRGFKTYLVYDSLARLSEVHAQKSLVPSPSITELVNETASDFRTLELSYDGYDNLTGVEDANGNTIAVVYDDVDRPELITTVPESTPVSWGFEYLDRVLKEVNLPDSSGSSAAHTGRMALLEHDSAGRPLAVRRDDSAHTPELRVGFAYDGLSQIRSLIRLKNSTERAHTAEYDRQGRATKATDANNSDPGEVDPKFSTAAYEPYCVGFATTSARGVRRKASFDTLCRLTQVEVGTSDADPLEVASASETRTFTYDDLGRLIGTVQNSPPQYGKARFGQSRYGGEPSTRSYEFDSLDRVTKVTFEDGKEMLYEHDEEGNVTQVTENASGTAKVTQFSYYGDNRLHQVTYVRGVGGVDSQTFTYSYDPGGRPLKLEYPESTGIVAEFLGPNDEVGWDGNGQLKHLRYKRGSSLVRRFEFGYDPAGNRVMQFEITPTKATYWAYGYDWLDRLESVKKVEITNTTILAQIQDLPAADALLLMGALQLVSVYQYNAADNRIEFQVPNLSNPALTETFRYSYDFADNITLIEKKVGSGSFSSLETFVSDDDGNLLTRTSGGVTTTYTWTDFNRLAAISTSDNSKKQSHTFGVNGFRRKKKDKNDVETTEYAAGLATAVSKAQSGDSVTYLMGHRLMGLERSSDGAMFWFLTDALSSVRDVVDSGGTVRASYEFSEYGQRIATSETGASSQKTFVGGMSVQDEVAETGLMMMGHRFYEPFPMGRFLNRDPIGFAGGPNLFEYARSSPASLVDATGLYVTPEGIVADIMLKEVEALFVETWTVSMSTAAGAPGPVPWKLILGGFAATTTVSLPLAAVAVYSGAPMASPDHEIKYGLLNPTQVEAFSQGKNQRRKCNESFALGRFPTLGEFATRTNSDWVGNYPELNDDTWKPFVFDKLRDRDMQINFNMEDIDIDDFERALDTPPGSRNGVETELVWIKRNYRKWRTRIYWYNGDNPIEDNYHERTI